MPEKSSLEHKTSILSYTQLTVSAAACSGTGSSSPRYWRVAVAATLENSASNAEAI